MDSNISKWIIDNYGVLGIGAIIVIALIAALIYERLKNSVKHVYDKKLVDYSTEKQKEKDKENEQVNLQVKAVMVVRDTGVKEILINVEVVNRGKKPCYVKGVVAILKPRMFKLVGSTLPPFPTSDDELDLVLNAPQKQITVEIKPDGGSHVWPMGINVNPHLRAYQKNGDTCGKGIVELTSGEKIEFYFPLLPDSAWDFLTAPIAPVFDGKVGHKCSSCGFIFLKHLDASSVTCPQCKHVGKPAVKSNNFNTEKIATAAEAIRIAYLPIVNLYEECSVLIENENEEKFKARLSQFKAHIDNFWRIYELNNVYLTSDAENDISSTVKKCFKCGRLCEQLEVVAKVQPMTKFREETYDRICLEIDKEHAEIMLLRPKVEKHFKSLIAGY